MQCARLLQHLGRLGGLGGLLNLLWRGGQAAAQQEVSEWKLYWGDRGLQELLGKLVSL